MVQDGTVLIDQGNTMIRNSSQDIETSLKAIADLDIEGLNEEHSGVGIGDDVHRQAVWI